MAGRRIALPADSISLSAGMADALLKKGSGDAALLYLYLLRHDGFYEPEEASRALRWERERLDGAMAHLGELGIQTGETAPVFTQPVPTREEAPEYSREDLAQAISDRSSDFPYLLEFTQKELGKRLTDRDTRTLLEIYDHLAFPAEVVMMLINWTCQEYAEKHGEGRKPPLSAIRSTAYSWKKSGVDTLEGAEAYLKKLSYYRSREGALLNAVGIYGRKAVDAERRNIHQWMDWGFPPETVAMAYEKTIYQTGKMSWSYCNGILRRWHNAGLHTPEEIRLHDAPRKAAGRGQSNMAPAPARPLSTAEQEARDRSLEENQRQIQRILDSFRQSENK